MVSSLFLTLSAMGYLEWEDAAMETLNAVKGDIVLKLQPLSNVL